MGRKHDNLIYLLHELNIKVNTIMATIQDVADAVNAESTVDDSIITLLNSIVAQLQAVIDSGDPASLDAVVSAIKANTAKLQAAVTANTPVTPALAAATV